MIGFFGSAPLAWPYLSSQAEDGDFALGVGVFFATIALGAVVAGGAGLILGSGIGWVWEHAHRWRRRRSGFDAAKAAATRDVRDAGRQAHGGRDPAAPPAGLDALAGDLAGRPLESITYRRDGLVLGFGSFTTRAPNDLEITSGGEVYRLPDPRARDVLHSLLGQRVHALVADQPGTAELRLEGGARLKGLPHPPGPRLARALRS